MLHEEQVWTRILWEASAQLALKSIRDPVQGLSDSTRVPNIMLR